MSRNKEPKPKKPTQKQLVLKYIKDFGSITAFEAFRDLGIPQLAARICELQDEGYFFVKTPEQVKTRYGTVTSIIRYSLKEAAA